MSQALSFKEKEYHFDVDALKQYRLMDELNYTYLCILLQRARFSSVKAGQRLKASYEQEHIVYLVKGHGIIKENNEKQYIDNAFRKPLFEKNDQTEVVFTDDSFLVRIERPLYEIFHKSAAFNSILS